MNFSLRQILCLRCSWCGKHILDEVKKNTKQGAVLFGFVKYAVCPNCLQKVNKEDQTADYKKKYDDFLEKRKMKAEKVIAEFYEKQTGLKVKLL